MFRLAAKLGAELRALGGYAGGTGVEMALTGHVAAQGHEDSGSEGKLIGAEKCGNNDIARGAQAAIGAKSYAAAQAVMDEDLLRFCQAKLPGIAGVLNAGKRRSTGASGVAGHHDVIGVGLGHSRGDGADTAA